MGSKDPWAQGSADRMAGLHESRTEKGVEGKSGLVWVRSSLGSHVSLREALWHNSGEPFLLFSCPEPGQNQVCTNAPCLSSWCVGLPPPPDLETKDKDLVT